jgi:precorrin-6B methylase 2
VTPRTVLVRARDLDVHLGDSDDVRISRGDVHVQTTTHALNALAAFSHPRPLGEVLDGAVAGTQDWIELSSAVHLLARAGILIEPGVPDTLPRGYARPPIHAAMLDDEVRTRGFIDALRAVVRGDDVVLDIGTGTGVLATAAAQAGAARVWAIESSAIADAAERVFASNGVADRATIVRGRSTSVTLKERCSVLVTEMIGNDPLDEQLLDVVDDAKRRLLTPNARIIPAAIEVVAVAVDVPRRILERRVFTAARVAEWRSMYGVDLSTLLAVRQSASDPFMVRTNEVITWPRVAPPMTLAAIDLEGPFELGIHKRITFAVDRDVERLGIVLAFRATLAPGIVLSTMLDEVSVDNHWRYGVWPAQDRPSLARGGTATIDYEHARGKTAIAFS